MNIEHLADLYLRNELSPQERDQLIEILNKDDEKSRQFSECLYEMGQILDAADQLREVRPHLNALGKELGYSDMRKGRGRYIESIAALLVLAFVTFYFLSEKTAIDNGLLDQEVVEEKSEKFLARIHSTGDSQWNSGSWLEKGVYFFKEATSITLDSGVEVDFGNDVEIELNDSNTITLKQGKLKAFVPQVAKGFTVFTEYGKVMDLGTEFVVEILGSEQVDVEGLSGSVQVYSNGENRLLKKSERLTYDQGGISSHSPEPLVPVNSLPNLLEQRSLNYVHWPFDQVKLGLTPAFAGGDFHDRFRAELKSQGGDGGPRFAEGAYGYALDLDGENDWAVTNFKGVSGSRPRTVSFWVKIPLDVKKRENYSFVSWGNSKKKGQKWQIGWNALPENGTVGAIRTEFKDGYVVGETDLRDGRWHHIVSLFIGGDDADVATHVRHYVDGKLEAVSGYLREKVSTNIDSINSKPVSFGRKMDGPKSFMKAKIDELYIIDAAVTPRQVRRLMEQNSLY